MTLEMKSQAIQTVIQNMLEQNEVELAVEMIITEADIQYFAEQLKGKEKIHIMNNNPILKLTDKK